MRVSVLFFASAKDITGTKKHVFEIESNQIELAQFLNLVFAEWPDLLKIAQTCCLSVNLEYVPKGAALVLLDGDEVAFIPPISGG